jgi:L-lysine 2,3-aminomutase
MYRIDSIQSQPPGSPRPTPRTITVDDVEAMMDRHGYADQVREIIRQENLLPTGLLSRLQSLYPQHSALVRDGEFLFTEQRQYSGLEGFRTVVRTLQEHGIDIGHIAERELFIEVYRFMATRHVLNSIDWRNFAEDSLFCLTFPQPGMIPADVVARYQAAATAAERTRIAAEYTERTNPHDGNQLLNRPSFRGEDGQTEFLDGSQHKYPQCQLVFDKSTQNCFAFCSYCFRHAQVRGDEDMFLQQDVDQVHRYLRQHPEVTDLLITGGDAGFMPPGRLESYVQPLLDDPSLLHVRTVRFATRALSYHPELVLSPRYDRMLALFDRLHDHGIQLAWMAHFSTPREVLNPSTIAAIRRLQRHGVKIRSQSPMMNHISLFTDASGAVDVDRSAQNWIDLGNLLATFGIGFHSMYCARPTGEHHYFTAPLADMNRIASKVHRELASINRPSRYISMTTSAGKISILGETEVRGEKAFALKFTESRNMAWMDRVFLAKFDAQETRVDLLQPLEGEEFFFEPELREIEAELACALAGRRQDAAAGGGDTPCADPGSEA